MEALWSEMRHPYPPQHKVRILQPRYNCQGFTMKAKGSIHSSLVHEAYSGSILETCLSVGSFENKRQFISILTNWQNFEAAQCI